VLIIQNTTSTIEHKTLTLKASETIFIASSNFSIVELRISMSLIDAIKNRRSIRAYKNKELPQGTIEKLIEAARQAPSAGNVQPWEFVVVSAQENKQAIAQAAYGQGALEEAQVVIVVCADENRAEESYGDRGRTLYCLQDTAAAIQNMLLTAHLIGLGTCWLGAFREDEVREVIKAPSGVRPVALIPVGYPNEAPPARTRRPLSEIMHKETF
jgi:nitroreductase